MSHTNSTTNYNLPQFIGTDKPTWLNDVNGAFSAIDTQMKANADSATSAGTSATSANTAIGTLSNLETTVKTDLVSAVNEVNTNLGVTSGVASSASSTATQANNKATAIETAFNMTQFANTPVADITKTNMTVGFGSLNTASNVDGSIGKIYGYLGGVKMTSSTGEGHLKISSPFRPTTAITIAQCVLFIRVENVAFNNESVMVRDLTINTNGDIDIMLDSYWYNRTFNVYLPPCVYFMKDFGDTPTPNA